MCVLPQYVRLIYVHFGRNELLIREFHVNRIKNYTRECEEKNAKWNFGKQFWNYMEISIKSKFTISWW
jgi:hypothetical protein